MLALIRCVIFNIDDILVETQDYQINSWMRLAHEQGIALDERSARKLIGRGRTEGLRILLQRASRDYSDGEILALSMRKSDLFLEYTRDMGPEDVLPGVLNNLKELREHGIRCAAVTSSINGGYVLRKTGIIGHMDALVDGNDIERFKPDPEIYRRAAYALRVSFEDCLVVENTENGMTAAHKLNMKVLAVGKIRNDPKADFCARDLDSVHMIDLLE